MLSDMNVRIQMVNDCEMFAIDMLERNPNARGKGEAEYHCQGYVGGVYGDPYNNTEDLYKFVEHVIGCKVVETNGRHRHTFTLDGKRIARHKIALRLGELGV